MVKVDINEKNDGGACLVAGGAYATFEQEQLYKIQTELKTVSDGCYRIRHCKNKIFVIGYNEVHTCYSEQDAIECLKRYQEEENNRKQERDVLLTEDMIDKIFEKAETEIEATLLLYKHVYPDFDKIKSGVWEAFCGVETYSKISEFTGFDLKTWINSYINWKEDLDEEAMKHFQENELDKYLTW